ncbi:hypothetical protein DFH09DRAFT_1305146 [Mycena vulgaris]|nr:hypothetical protein DFH09DRAFT_1305146 [Mycena vulgaris]
MSFALKPLGLVFLLLSSAAAQATTLPQCALGCAKTAATTVGCDLSDTVCLCKTSFASSVLQCAGATSCSPDDQSEVSTILAGMCTAASSSASASGSSASSGV